MATQTSQGQSGSDISTSVKQPTRTESTRQQPEQVTLSESGASTQTTVQRGSTSQQVARQRVGCSISFTIKVTNNLPPITTA